MAKRKASRMEGVAAEAVTSRSQSSDGVTGLVAGPTQSSEATGAEDDLLSFVEGFATPEQINLERQPPLGADAGVPKLWLKATDKSMAKQVLSVDDSLPDSESESIFESFQLYCNPKHFHWGPNEWLRHQAKQWSWTTQWRRWGLKAWDVVLLETILALGITLTVIITFFTLRTHFGAEQYEEVRKKNFPMEAAPVMGACSESCENKWKGTIGVASPLKPYTNLTRGTLSCNRFPCYHLFFNSNPWILDTDYSPNALDDEFPADWAKELRQAANLTNFTLPNERRHRYSCSKALEWIGNNTEKLWPERGREVVGLSLDYCVDGQDHGLPAAFSLLLQLHPCPTEEPQLDGGNLTHYSQLFCGPNDSAKNATFLAVYVKAKYAVYMEKP